MPNKTLVPTLLGVAVLVAGGSVWLWQDHVHTEQAKQTAALKRLNYKADGYGGFVPSGAATPVPRSNNAKAVLAPVATMATPAPKPSPVASGSEPLQKARAAYAKGDYKAAERAAKIVVASAPTTASLHSLRPTGTATVVEVASAQHLLAFAAARQGDLKTARTRFAEARKDAEVLPKASPAPSAMGEPPSATLAEDAAYQHAACTMGLGDKVGAEREYVQFLRDFPESPLVHGCMRRIARLHGGDIPKEAEAVWKTAQAIQRKAQEERDRQAAMCAPDCLAYLMGGAASVETLAKEMRTGGDGTTLAALVETAKRHGYPNAKGVRLTEAGLKQQTLPVIALIAPGHFVVVTKTDAAGVTVWDSGTVTFAEDGDRSIGGADLPRNPRFAAPVPSEKSDAVRTMTWQEWQQTFGGAKSGSGVAVIGLKGGVAARTGFPPVVAKD